MNWNQILVQVIIWFLYLLGQSFLMNGIKISSEGNSEIMPDGKIRPSEMIFAPIALYLNQSKLVKIYYTPMNALEIIRKISLQFPSLQIEYPYSGERYRPNSPIKMQKWIELKTQIEDIFDIKLEFNGDVLIYREYTEYKFSKYIRKPILGCIVCMPSFWGIWTCLVPGIIVFGFHWWNIPVYVLNTCSLAYLNYKIYKPL